MTGCGGTGSGRGGERSDGRVDHEGVPNSGPATRSEVAAACGAQEAWTEKLLTACAGLGLLQREGETFRNTPFAAGLIDLAQTEPITREIIHSFGLEERVGFRSRDFLRDSYGEGNDVVLLSGVLHGQPASDCLLMLRKAHEALAPGGLVAVQELLLTEEKDGPLLPALFSLHMTRGAAYTGSEIAGWMGSAGFTGTEVRHLSGYSWMNGLVLGRKAG